MLSITGCVSEIAISFQFLKGLTFQSVRLNEPIVDTPYRTMDFITENGDVYQLFNGNDTCDELGLKDIEGDLDDLIGSPIILAEVTESDYIEYTERVWIFYRLATAKGYVVIRFYTTTDGWYSDDAITVRKGTFIEMEKYRQFIAARFNASIVYEPNDGYDKYSQGQVIKSSVPMEYSCPDEGVITLLNDLVRAEWITVSDDWKCTVTHYFELDESKLYRLAV